MGKKKEKLKSIDKENSNYRISLLALFIAFIGLVIACIGIIPTVKLLTQKPKLSLTRSSVDTTSDRVITQYEISNKGDAIATDIFIAMETYEDDTVDLFLGLNGTVEHKGKDCRITISSLAPDETTSLIVISFHKKEYVEFAKKLGRLPRQPNIHSIDFREGKISDVVRY